MKNYDKNIDIILNLMYLNANNLYGWEMSQKLPANGFKRVKNLSKFDEDFIKNMTKTVTTDMFLKQISNTQNVYLILKLIYYFYLKERKLKNARGLFAAYMTKKTLFYT